VHKDLRPLVKQLKKNGYTVAQTRGNHYGVYAPDGKLLQVIAGTTSDHRSMKNLKADLRRKGMID
jgi:predicted RNA binding protein YcfA (HicA-like mRNA interferase family)